MVRIETTPATEQKPTNPPQTPPAPPANPPQTPPVPPKPDEPNGDAKKTDETEQKEASEESGKGKNKDKKLTKKERKEKEKEQAALEKQLIEEGKIPPRIPYKPRHTLGRILAVCIAFFFGVFVTLGGLIGGVISAGTQTKIKDVAKFAGFDYSQVFTEEAANLSLLDLVQELTKIDKDNFTLQTADKYTPLVKKTLDDLCGQLEPLGVHVSTNELMALKFSEMGAYLQNTVLPSVVLGETLKIPDDDTADPIMRALCYKADGTKTTVGDLQTGASDIVKGVALADALSVKDDDSADRIMRALCYKTDGAKTTIGDLTDGASEIINDIEVEALLNTNGASEPALRYLAYGSEEDESGNARYHVDETTKAVAMVSPHKKRTVGSITAADADLIGGAKICDLVQVGNDSPRLLHAIGDWTVTELSQSNKIETLKIGDLFEIEGTDGLMPAIRDWSISDLQQQSRIERLKIVQVIPAGGDTKFMQAIGDWRIGDLSKQAKFNSLTMADFLTLSDAPKLLKTIENTPLGAIGDTVNSLRLADILDESDLNGNTLLKNLKTSSLDTLAQDIQNISVRQVFGDEIYCYLSIKDTKAAYDAAIKEFTDGGGDIARAGVIERGTYAELVNGYAKNRLVKELSDLVPHAVVLKTGERIETYRTANGVRVAHGYFDGENNPIAESEVRKDKTGLYFLAEKTVTPVYAWKLVAYADGDPTDLPSGDSVNADGTQYSASDGNSYPVAEDDYGYYYRKGDARIDLDKVLSGYLLNGETLPLNSDGSVTLDGKKYHVRTRGETRYLPVRTAVTEKYYAEEGGGRTYFTEEQTTEKYEKFIRTAAKNGARNWTDTSAAYGIFCSAANSRAFRRTTRKNPYSRLPPIFRKPRKSLADSRSEICICTDSSLRIPSRIFRNYGSPPKRIPNNTKT